MSEPATAGRLNQRPGSLVFIPAWRDGRTDAIGGKSERRLHGRTCHQAGEGGRSEGGTCSEGGGSRARGARDSLVDSNTGSESREIDRHVTVIGKMNC